MEDFSFADFLHLAVYHKRDIFAPSPVGVSPRTWNSDSMHPALSRPAQHLPDCSAASSNHRHTRVSRRSPIGAKMALAGTENGEKAKNDTEAERVRSIEVPEMEKWAKLLQSGGAGPSPASVLYLRSYLAPPPPAPPPPPPSSPRPELPQGLTFVGWPKHLKVFFVQVCLGESTPSMHQWQLWPVWLA